MFKETGRGLKQELGDKISRITNWLENQIGPLEQELHTRETLKDLRLKRQIDYTILMLLLDAQDYKNRIENGAILNHEETIKFEDVEILLKLEYGEEGFEKVLAAFIEEKAKRQKELHTINS